MHSIESRFVIDPSNMLFAGMYMYTFLPEKLQARAVKGLTYFRNVHDVQVTK